jgi:hypothetical protein
MDLAGATRQPLTPARLPEAAGLRGCKRSRSPIEWPTTLAMAAALKAPEAAEPVQALTEPARKVPRVKATCRALAALQAAGPALEAARAALEAARAVLEAAMAALEDAGAATEAAEAVFEAAGEGGEAAAEVLEAAGEAKNAAEAVFEAAGEASNAAEAVFESAWEANDSQASDSQEAASDSQEVASEQPSSSDRPGTPGGRIPQWWWHWATTPWDPAKSKLWPRGQEKQKDLKRLRECTTHRAPAQRSCPACRRPAWSRGRRSVVAARRCRQCSGASRALCGASVSPLRPLYGASAAPLLHLLAALWQTSGHLFQSKAPVGHMFEPLGERAPLRNNF